MMNIGKNILTLRKKNKVTQEELAKALNVSPQAVSKWENDISQPDIIMLPVIAEYFKVSIDWLFYGEDMAYEDIYVKNLQKVWSHGQLEGFEEVLKLFGAAQHGLHMGFHSLEKLKESLPLHISGTAGVSIYSGKGFGAVVTRNFFESIGPETVSFALPVLKALADENCLRILMAVISMSDISYDELKDKLRIDEEALRSALEVLISGGMLIETVSKHKLLGTTYRIHDIYHSCLCMLLAIMEVQRISIEGISCCMEFGDFPLKI